MCGKVNRAVIEYSTNQALDHPKDSVLNAHAPRLGRWHIEVCRSNLEGRDDWGTSATEWTGRHCWEENKDEVTHRWIHPMRKALLALKDLGVAEQGQETSHKPKGLPQWCLHKAEILSRPPRTNETQGPAPSRTQRGWQQTEPSVPGDATKPQLTQSPEQGENPGT